MSQAFEATSFSGVRKDILYTDPAYQSTCKEVPGGFGIKGEIKLSFTLISANEEGRKFNIVDSNMVISLGSLDASWSR